MGVEPLEFEKQSKLRDIQTEFRLLRKLTETKEHQANLEKFEKKLSSLNRYSELTPYKHTKVRLPQRIANIYDSYINANYINVSLLF